jgi:hypothetical protein
MPSASINTAVNYWPIRTREEMDAAGWDITDTVQGATAHTMRSYDNATNIPDPHLAIFQMGSGNVLDAYLGGVIIHNGTWTRVTEEEAVAAGLPIDPLPEP